MKQVFYGVVRYQDFLKVRKEVQIDVFCRLSWTFSSNFIQAQQIEMMLFCTKYLLI